MECFILNDGLVVGKRNGGLEVNESRAEMEMKEMMKNEKEEGWKIKKKKWKRRQEENQGQRSGVDCLLRKEGAFLFLSRPGFASYRNIPAVSREYYLIVTKFCSNQL